MSCLFCPFLSKMADAAAARREARRKRILENSQNRLKIISGKSTDGPVEEFTAPSSQAPSPIPDYNELNLQESSSSSRSSLYNGVLFPEADSLAALLLTPEIAAGDNEVFNETATFGPASTTEQVQTTTLLDKLTSNKIDIVILSMLIQLLDYFSILDLENSYLFFLLFVYSVTKLIWFPSQSNSKMTSILMLLNGLSPNANRLKFMITAMQWSSALFQDVCLFLFTTICMQSFLITVKENFFT